MTVNNLYVMKNNRLVYHSTSRGLRLSESNAIGCTEQGPAVSCCAQYVVVIRVQ